MLIIIVVIILVVLFVVVPLIFVGILYTWTSELEGTEEQTVIIISKQPSEKSYGWQIEITDISGTISLEDARFQVVDSNGVLEYSVTIDDASPAAFTKGSSTVYAMTKYSGVTIGNSTIPVSGTTALTDYSKCFIAYFDQTSDGKINGGDSLYIYKDYDADGTDDVLSNYDVKIITSNDEMAMNKAL
jgi:hypothetical protein